jgi:gentisate 1,2-dioxygenase
MSTDGRTARQAVAGEHRDRRLAAQIAEQRTPPERRVLRLGDREWEGNVQRLVDPQNGFDDRCLACFVRRLPPGGSSDVHRHSFEAIGYVLRGHGYEIHDGERIDWREGDVVHIPANVWHQHVNLSEDEEAHLLLVTNYPQMVHLRACTMEPAPSWEDALQRPSVYTDPFLDPSKNA